MTKKSKESHFHICESPHSSQSPVVLEYVNKEGRLISKDGTAFDDCMILSEDSFDPDAVFLDDIVEDDVLPYLSLEVDGLTTPKEGRSGQLVLHPDDVAANEIPRPDTTLPNVAMGPDGLEVYGWESSLWKKIKGYLGF